MDGFFAESALLAPCVVGGTAEWGQSRPCLFLERILLLGIRASSMPAFFLLQASSNKDFVGGLELP